MTYNELLLKIYEMIENNNKDNNKKSSSLFRELFNLLNLENICEEYTRAPWDLSPEDVKKFSEYASLDSEARRMFIKCYEKAYDEGEIDKIKYLKEYDSIGGYIVATLFNEFGHEFYKKEFLSLFNKKINNVFIESSVDLNELKTVLMVIPSLSMPKEKLGLMFKRALKEIEIASMIYKNEGINGLAILDIYKMILTAVETNISNEEKYKEYSELDDEEKIEKTMEFVQKITDIKEVNPYDIFRSMGKGRDWFDNNYYGLVHNLCSNNSVIDDLLKNDSTAYAAGLFVYYLQYKDFLDKVTTNDGSILHFKNLSGMIKLLKENALDLSIKDYVEFSKHKRQVYYNMNEIMKKIMNGSIDIEKLNKGIGTM